MLQRQAPLKKKSQVILRTESISVILLTVKLKNKVLQQTAGVVATSTHLDRGAEYVDFTDVSSYPISLP